MPNTPDEPTKKTPTTARVVINKLKNMLSGGMVGAAADNLKSRPSRIEEKIREADGTDDPTRVEYGGNVGSSVKR